MILEVLFFLNPKYNNKFQKIALHIYHHTKIIGKTHHLVVVYQLQLVLICIDSILHQVNIAKKPCQNSCINVTSKLIEYTIKFQYGINSFNNK